MQNVVNALMITVRIVLNVCWNTPS